MPFRFSGVSLDIDLRDLPRYFWLGLVLEAIGASGLVLCAADKRSGLWYVVFTVFSAGFALCATAVIFARKRKGGSPGEGRVSPRRRSSRGVRWLGAALVAAGLFGVIVSLVFGAYDGVAVSMIGIVLGVIYWVRPDLPARRLTESKNPRVAHAAVHAKYILELMIGCAVVAGYAFYRYLSPDAADSVTWWAGLLISACCTLYLAWMYIWHCWIKRDYVDTVAF